jgi:hypothetical protein
MSPNFTPPPLPPAARAAVTLLFLVPAWGPVLYEVQVNAATLIFTSTTSSSNTPVGLIGSFFSFSHIYP